MLRRILLPLGCILVLVACATETPPEPADTTGAPEATGQVPGVSFLALHLYNPASDDAHQQFLTGLGAFNQAVASAGHPETRYRAWKVIGEQAGAHGYLFGSLWADRATYDVVHEHADYKAVMTEFEDSGREPFEAEVYNRYALLNPATTPPPPMPDGGATFLSFHLFNLSSAEAEKELVDMLERLNGEVARAGHPETRYGVWKVTGDQTGDYAYAFGSVWADRAAYDTVHEHPDYKALLDRDREAYMNLVGDEVYNKYELLQ